MLKYSTPHASKLAAISLVVITAATGWPLPMGLPIVTMSGTTPGQCKNILSLLSTFSFFSPEKQQKLRYYIQNSLLLTAPRGRWDRIFASFALLVLTNCIITLAVIFLSNCSQKHCFLIHQGSEFSAVHNSRNRTKVI